MRGLVASIQRIVRYVVCVASQSKAGLMYVVDVRFVEGTDALASRVQHRACSWLGHD